MRSPGILNQIADGITTLLKEPVGERSVKITDLTPRDGQQCKLATRVSRDLLVERGFQAAGRDARMAFRIGADADLLDAGLPQPCLRCSSGR